MSGAQAFRLFLDGAHDAEEVAAVDLLDVRGGVALFEQGAGEGGELVVGVELRRDAADAIEVGADADVVDAADLDGVVDLGDDIGEGGGRESCRWPRPRASRWLPRARRDLRSCGPRRIGHGARP